MFAAYSADVSTGRTLICLNGMAKELVQYIPVEAEVHVDSGVMYARGAVLVRRLDAESGCLLAMGVN
jgi:hypothetical protein